MPTAEPVIELHEHINCRVEPGNVGHTNADAARRFARALAARTD